MCKLKIPPKYKDLDCNTINQMKVKALTMEDGVLCATVYDNLEQFTKHNNLDDFIGPFADKIGVEQCFRFESSQAARHLSD